MTAAGVAVAVDVCVGSRVGVTLGEGVVVFVGVLVGVNVGVQVGGGGLGVSVGGGGGGFFVLVARGGGGVSVGALRGDDVGVQSGSPGSPHRSWRAGQLASTDDSGSDEMRSTSSSNVFANNVNLRIMNASRMIFMSLVYESRSWLAGEQGLEGRAGSAYSGEPSELNSERCS
jgi:hypothetical protein